MFTWFQKQFNISQFCIQKMKFPAFTSQDFYSLKVKTVEFQDEHGFIKGLDIIWWVTYWLFVKAAASSKVKH